MTTDRHFERQLPDLLEDLYLGSTPDYRDEVLAVAVRSRQRPAWTFIGRWLPMADIASRSTLMPRVPMRSLVVGLVIVALLLAGLAVFVGTRPRVPAPFGLARNGLIAYASGGDIYTADPDSGVVRSVVTGTENDRNPRFSRDGTQIAFLRQAGPDVAQFDLAVVRRDGGSVRILTLTPVGVPELVEWSADGDSIIVNTADARLTRYDVTGTHPPLVVAEGVHVQPGGFRPPDGAQILYQPDGIPGTALWVMNADGTAKHSLLERGSEADGGAISGSVAWSPDGRLVAFGLNGAHDTYPRINVVNADGTDVRRLDQEPGVWLDNDLVWSPDGSRIAFNRWRQDEQTLSWQIQPIGIVSVTGGAVVGAGPAPVSDGATFDWSPDGRTILSIPGTIVQWPNPAMTSAKPTLIDPAARTAHELGVTVGSAASWQRRAP